MDELVRELKAELRGPKAQPYANRNQSVPAIA